MLHPGRLVRDLIGLTGQPDGAAVQKGSPNPLGGWCQQLWGWGGSQILYRSMPSWQGHLCCLVKRQGWWWWWWRGS